MKTGISEILLLTLIILILFGPALLRILNRFIPRFAKRTRRFLLRLQHFLDSMSRTVQILILAIAILVILFQTAVYFILRNP